VVLAGLEEHAVAGADLLYRAALALAAAEAFGDEDRLPDGVRMPVGAGARGEVHAAGAGAGRGLGGGDYVDEHQAGERARGALGGVE
jgi:hypothetical protein